MKPSTNYERNVFINCPFDKQYAVLFNAIVFTIHSLGLKPRCTKLVTGAENRLRKIIQLIHDSKYGIHDISRVELDEENNLPRFNMPFELGIDLACKEFAPERIDKELIILDSEQYRLFKCLSDIGGFDPRAHNNDREEIIQIVSDWLRENLKNPELPNAKQIYQDYKDFLKYYKIIRRGLPKNPAFVDFSFIIADWLNKLREKQ